MNGIVITDDSDFAITEAEQEKAIRVLIGTLLGAWDDLGVGLIEPTSGRPFPLHEHILTRLTTDPGESPQHIPALRRVIRVLGDAVNEWEQHTDQRAPRGEGETR